MVLILYVAGYVMRANGGCQTPCLVISACASTPPLNCRCYVASAVAAKKLACSLEALGCGFQGEIDVSDVGRAEIGTLMSRGSRKFTLA